MARTSINISVSKLLEYYHSRSPYQEYIRDLYQNYLISDNFNSSDSESLAAVLPDLESVLGRHLLYGHSVTFRIVSMQASSDQFYGLDVRSLTGPLPTTNPGPQYVPAPSWDHFSEALQMFTKHAYPEPGSNITISEYYGEPSENEKSETVYNILKNKVFVLGCFGWSGPNVKIYTTLANGTAPYITVYYDSTALAERSLKVTGVTSGYMNPRRANTIGWSLPVSTGVYYCLSETVPPVHETLYWRISGGSTWTSISLPDGDSSYDIPANTFPTGSNIEWKLSVTDADGITTESSVFSITTTDDTSTAAPTAPVDSVEIGNKPIPFTWTVSNPTGEAPSRVKVEWATAADAAEWSELVDSSSAIYSYTAAANTFPGGTIYWRVTSYNADSVQGPTSSVVSFSCVAPPYPPNSVIADTAPFTTISWQAAVQTAYEITVDGKVVEKKFGAGVYSYQMKDPLPDGLHTIGVRVQGGYGYWSTEATTTTVIENEGEGTITAFGTFGTDASLSWECTSEETDLVFRVYRDGSMIARTRNTFFLDRFVLGQHSYEILAELSGGNYIRSAAVSGIMKSCVTQIAAAAGGNWLELKLSENSNRVESFEWNRNLTLRHYAGSAYPVAEFSPYEDRKATYDCAFTTVEAAKAFEQLQGQIVILKSRGGEVMIGPLTPISKVTGEFYITYQFSVQQIHWEEFIDETDS